jgi:tRNA(Ile)-lysidine synthase
MLVALSGGGDSMALLCLLRAAWRGRIVAAHLEHGLRGAPSLEDAKFVENFCRSAGVECFVRHADVMKEKERGESAEMAGRRARYGFFSEICAREGIPFIATAHNAEDVVETVVHHAFRGSGIAGLSGISGARGSIVRPLINCARGELRDFLRAEGIPWREDETNARNDYVRNRIRNQLLPWARSNINEAADRSLLGLADECGRVSSMLSDEARGFVRLVSRTHPFALAAWDARAASRIPKTHLALALREQGRALSLPALDRKRMGELCGLMGKTGRRRFQWAGDVEVCLGGRMIGWLSRDCLKSPDTAEAAVECGKRSGVAWGFWDVAFEMAEGAPLRRGIGVWSAEFPSDAPFCKAVVSSADAFAKGIGSVKFEIPWWSSYNTPVVSLECENSREVWLPGARSVARSGGDYVIIAKVFARTPNRLGEEKTL